MSRKAFQNIEEYLRNSGVTPYELTGPDFFNYKDYCRNIAKIKIDGEGNPIFDTNEERIWFDKMCETSINDGGFSEVIDYYEGPASSRRGNRSWGQYAKDLVYSWILEDIFVGMLKANGIDIRNNGSDKARDIIVYNKQGKIEPVNNEPDFLVSVDGSKPIYLELQQSSSSWEKGHGLIELRNEKLANLFRKKGLFLFHDIVNKEFVIFDMEEDDINGFVFYHTYFGKIQYGFIIADHREPISTDKMIDVLKSNILKEHSKEVKGHLEIIPATVDYYKKADRWITVDAVVEQGLHCLKKGKPITLTFKDINARPKDEKGRRLVDPYIWRKGALSIEYRQNHRRDWDELIKKLCEGTKYDPSLVYTKKDGYKVEEIKKSEVGKNNPASIQPPRNVDATHKENNNKNLEHQESIKTEEVVDKPEVEQESFGFDDPTFGWA